jgi:hypothetical protein
MKWVALLCAVFGSCQLSRDSGPQAEAYAEVWRKIIGREVAEQVLWATPSHVGSPSLCFEPRPGGAYVVEAVSTDHVVLRSRGGLWFVPLGVVQLRLEDSVVTPDRAR